MRFNLSHAQIQMARELGMNPKNFGSLANHDQEGWKTPLPRFIEDLYCERFGRERPDEVLSIEDAFLRKRKKVADRKPAEECEIEKSEPDEGFDCPF